MASGDGFHMYIGAQYKVTYHSVYTAQYGLNTRTQGNTSREVKLMNRMQDFEQQIKAIMEQAVYDCATDEAGYKVKRCNKCMQNMGRTAGHAIICLKELEAKQ